MICIAQKIHSFPKPGWNSLGWMTDFACRRSVWSDSHGEQGKKWEEKLQDRNKIHRKKKKKLCVTKRAVLNFVERRVFYLWRNKHLKSPNLNPQNQIPIRGICFSAFRPNLGGWWLFHPFGINTANLGCRIFAMPRSKVCLRLKSCRQSLHKTSRA